MPPVTCDDEEGAAKAWVCDATLPIEYEGLCPTGCYLHTPRQTVRFDVAVKTAKKVPKLERLLDLSMDETEEALAEVAAVTSENSGLRDGNAALVARLEDAYTVGDVVLWTAVGVGSGVLLGGLGMLLGGL